MSGIEEAIRELEDIARNLQVRAKALGDTQRLLEPVEKTYREEIEDFELSLYDESQKNDGGKLPSEKVRSQLAHRAMKRETRDRYGMLTAKRERLKEEIRDLRAAADCARSVLSAEKTTMEATT